MSDTFPASFYSALSQSGIGYSGPVHTDDRIHRFKADGDHGENSWYALRVRDGIVFGGFGCWRRNVVQGWCSQKNLTREQTKLQADAMREFRERDQQERAEKQAKARQIVADGLKSWSKATSHAYLDAKKLKPAGDLRVCNNDLYPGWLVVPMFDAKGQVQSCQYIADDGTKRFQFGGMVQGCFFPILPENDDKGSPLVICEGYATGKSIFDSTGWATLCAFNCGNLLPVARIARKTYPDRLIIIAGDDDAATQDNPGLTKATEAAKETKAVVCIPKFTDSADGKLTDFNDLAQISGNSEVRQQILAAIPTTQKPPSILIVERQFDFSRKPPEVRPIFRLKDTVIATPGNLVTITSQVKTGKSAMVGAMEASTMVAPDSDSDCLGFRSSNMDKKLVLHFDSEQSPDDHWFCSMRTLRRANMITPPTWFKSYCLTGLGHKRAWDCVLEAVKRGPVHSIFLDGTADFVADVNDAAESNDFVARLHDLAINLDCPIIGVIHFNPGGEKSRGHLGSQLERKAESNLRLDKESETTVIWSEKQRGAPIMKNNGPAFRWSDDKQMHISCASFGDAKLEAERDILKASFEDAFIKRPGMPFSDLAEALQKVTGQSSRTIERKIHKAFKLGVIGKIAGVYSLNK